MVAGTAHERLKQQLTRPQQRQQKRGAKGRKKPAAGLRWQHCMIVLVLDELDRLMAQDQAVLYELFLLPQVMVLRIE